MSQQKRPKSLRRGHEAVAPPGRASRCGRSELQLARPNAALGVPPSVSNDAGAALAKADRRIAVPPAMGAEDHLVAAFEIGAGLARGQRDVARPSGAQLAEAAVALGGRPGDRAAAENVAGQQVAAAAG